MEREKKYSFLKAFFERELNNLPETLENGFMKINNVKEYVEGEIKIVDLIIKRAPKNINDIAQARAGAGGLYRVFKMLEERREENKKDKKLV